MDVLAAKGRKIMHAGFFQNLNKYADELDSALEGIMVLSLPNGGDAYRPTARVHYRRRFILSCEWQIRPALSG